MAKINFSFNGVEYSVDESALSDAAAELHNHLSTAMSGSGSMVTFGGISYNIDSEKLSNYTDDFISHLGEIAGGDSNVVINGVKYFIDSAKVQDAVTDLEDVLGNLNSGSGATVDKYSWEAVFASIDAGTYATDYAIGDSIPLDLGSEGLINMQIAAFDADDLADGSGKAPITWIAKELLATKHVFHSSKTLEEGWIASDIRSYLKDTIKPMIPSLVRNAIVEVTKDYRGLGIDGYTADYVWLPSYYNELVNGRETAKYLNLFPDAETLKKCIVGTTTPVDWWTRGFNTEQSYRIVTDDGDFSNPRPNRENGVCLCFCT